MAVRVEFFGVARSHAGRESINVDATCVQDVFDHIARTLPELARTCFRDGKLIDAFLINVNGDRFTRDSATRLANGDSVLLMSADSGG